MNFKSSLSAAFVLASILLSGASAIAQQPVTWFQAKNFDTGKETSVSIVRNGEYVVEFHQSSSTSRMWYHVGNLITTFPGFSVRWGKSHDTGVKGDWPSVTVTKEGYVILVNSPANQVVNQITYWVGKIDLNGSNDQDIQWLVSQQAFGYGFHPSVAVNTNGQIALVYECKNGCSSELHYRTGHLDNPAQGRFNIVWDSGKDGIKYDNGINPHIAINDKGQVIETHQTQSNESLLHYRRGALTTTGIDFKPSHRYDDNGRQPAVTLTNAGQVIELHTKGDSLMSRTGDLASDPEIVNWSVSTDIGWYYYNLHPAITSNSRGVLGTWTAGNSRFSSPGDLQFSDAPLN